MLTLSFRRFWLFVVLISTHSSWSQINSIHSEQLLPKDAVTVFSINNISLLQKIAMDDLVNYEFMSEVHQELFDGSTSNKTLKDAGINFDERLNLFYGKSIKYELSGFTFGVSDKKSLFDVFDDFQYDQSQFEGLEVYGTFFNNLLIKDNQALLIRIEPTMQYIDEVTDSIWFARGYEMPFEFFDEESFDEEASFEIDPSFIDEESALEEQESILEEEIYDEEQENSNVFPEASENPLVKNYYELRDSVQVILQQKEFSRVVEEIFINGQNLFNADERFASQLSHQAEAAFYMDNARNLNKAQGFWYFQTVLPTLYQDIQDLYAGNVILGDLFLRDNQIDFEVEAQYGASLGSIYTQMNDARFDANVLDYIPASSPAYFTYNINLQKAYEQAFKVVLPLLSDEKNAQIAVNVLTLELLNEFINKDAIFDTYKGSMFGTFNGIKKVNTKKIEFTFDEQSFEYQEIETETQTDMPIFTFGFSTSRPDIPEMILKQLSRLSSRIQHFDNYWRIDNAVLDAVPLYILNTGDLLLISNDEDMARFHYNGYGNESLSKKQRKAAKKSGFMYGKIDVFEALDRFPLEVLSAENAEIFSSFKGKSGQLELTSSQTSETHTNIKLSYQFDGQETPGEHLLDMINSLYVMYTLNP